MIDLVLTVVVAVLGCALLLAVVVEAGAGTGGRPVRQKQAQGILVAALGMLAAHFGYGEVRRVS